MGDAVPDIRRILELITPAKALAIVLLFLATAGLVRLAGWLLERFAERTPRFRIRVKQAIPLVRVAAWTLAVYLAVAGIVQPGADLLLGMLAAAGVAVGFGAQELLGNLIGGISLIFDRPFNVGDKVEIGEHYGEIVWIGLHSVRMRTPDDDVVVIPNGRVVSEPVANASGGDPSCQVVTDLWLPADVDVGLARRLGFEAAASSRYVTLERPIEVVADAVFRETFLVRIRVKAYVGDHRDELRFRTEVVEATLEELRRRGIVTRELVLRRFPAEEV